MTVTEENGPKVITPPDTLSGKVSYGPGGVDVEALERADAVVAGLKRNYLDWVQEDFSKLMRIYEKAVETPALERGPVVHDLFFVAHDMKGQGGSFNYHLVTQIGNLLCRFIEANEGVPGIVFDKPQMEVIKLHVDAIRLVITQRWEGDGGRQGKNLVAGLQAVVAKNAPPMKS